MQWQQSTGLAVEAEQYNSQICQERHIAQTSKKSQNND